MSLAFLAIIPGPANAIDPNEPAVPHETVPVPGSPASLAASSNSALPASPAKVAFDPARRVVSNWSAEAMENLDLSAKAKADLAGPGPLAFPRCVMLNNYWCIKRARWAGEIAADSEGHVAFASAIDGAIAATMLLRRYYLDYNRRSALAILSRWAPAQCGNIAPTGRPLRAPRPASFATLRGVAPHGIQNTLHARWLAAHRQGFPRVGKTGGLRRSIVPSLPLALMRAPEIAVGMGERPAPITLKRIAALDFAAPKTSLPGAACGGENTRVQNYAARAIEGIAASPNDDLNLFLADGTAGANLPRLLENMAKVEIGPMAARTGLITAAIDRLTPRNLAVGMPRQGD